MSVARTVLENSLFNQSDESVSVPISIRIPTFQNNELEEIASSLGRSKSALISEFIKAGIAETNSILREQSVLNMKDNEPSLIETETDASRSFLGKKYFMLNTNYNNDPETHFDMLKNHEVAAFCTGWKEYICQLRKGDKVYLYQSGVGVVAVGTVDGDLVKSEHYGVADDKYSKSLSNFKMDFKAVSAKRFKELADGGINFRRTMIEVSRKLAHALDQEIEVHISEKQKIM